MDRGEEIILFADGMTVYLENTKESTNKLPEWIISEFSKVAGYKINIQKSVGFPFPTSEVLVREGKTYHLKLCKNVHEFALSRR